MTRRLDQIRRSALALALAGACTGSLALAPDASTTTQLPRGVRPTHYEVSVVPHAGTKRFDGRVTATIEVLEATSRITLNAVDMRFTSVRLAGMSGRVSVDAVAQTATFTFARPIPIGRYELSMSYVGVVGTRGTGLFALDYASPKGRKRALYTQFENSDARRFIPCWDEPAYKATFAMEAIVPAGEMAVSNMPATSATPFGKGLRRVRFAASPTMSTYLLFFAVGDFERATDTAGATEIGVVTRRGAAAQAAFALASTKDVLREYNDYFGIPYPLPKLDNIAAPGRSQFFGAMENWGAIFTFEFAMLLDPAFSTLSDKQGVFETAAHEIAHQWFGNLVTMSWWDDIWLNEGFASWMAARTTQRLHPEWKTTLSAVQTRGRAMGLDALQTTHAVVQPVATVDQANQAFDDITYAKGEAVIRMLEAYVGPDAWRDGVRSYLKANAYGNTVSDDLWREIEAAAGKPITDIAHDFTLQPGIPLLRVESSVCRGDETVLELSQGEFSADRPDKPPLRWRVPVLARVAGGPLARTLLTEPQTVLTVPGCGAVVVNAGQSGYYRTLYAPAQHAALEAGFAAFDPIDQLGLMDDAWALGLAGLQTPSTALELVARTPDDADPKVWSDIVQRMSGLSDLYRGDPARQAAWRTFAVARLSPIFSRVGWQAATDEAASITVLRTELIETLSALGDATTIAEARRRYALPKAAADGDSAELRRSILGVVSRHADAATWGRLRAAAKAEKTPLIRGELYAALATVEDEALARRVLALALTDEPGLATAAAMIAAVSNEHPDLAFDFAVAHRARVNRLVDASVATSYYADLGSHSLDMAMVGKIKAFADAHIPAESRRAAEAAMASVRYRVGVFNDRLPAIDTWLKTRPL